VGKGQSSENISLLESAARFQVEAKAVAAAAPMAAGSAYDRVFCKHAMEFVCTLHAEDQAGDLAFSVGPLAASTADLWTAPLGELTNPTPKSNLPTFDFEMEEPGPEAPAANAAPGDLRRARVDTSSSGIVFFSVLRANLDRLVTVPGAPKAGPGNKVAVSLLPATLDRATQTVHVELEGPDARFQEAHTLTTSAFGRQDYEVMRCWRRSASLQFSLGSGPNFSNQCLFICIVPCWF